MTAFVKRRELLLGFAALPVASHIAVAETYPSRPVRILVATSAGGGTDLVARFIAQWLTDRLGQSFFVENRPGGGNNIGTEAAVRAKPLVGRAGLGRRRRSNRSPRPKGARTVSLSSASSLTPTAKRGLTNRSKASAVEVSGA